MLSHVSIYIFFCCWYLPIGMEWVAQNGNRPAVASMSLGGGSTRSVNEGLAGLFDAGVLSTVSAGNDNSNSCFKSPAGAPQVHLRSSYRIISYAYQGRSLTSFVEGPILSRVQAVQTYFLQPK